MKPLILGALRLNYTQSERQNQSRANYSLRETAKNSIYGGSGTLGIMSQIATVELGGDAPLLKK